MRRGLSLGLGNYKGGGVWGEQQTEGFFIFMHRLHDGKKPSAFTATLPSSSWSGGSVWVFSEGSDNGAMEWQVSSDTMNGKSHRVF